MRLGLTWLLFDSFLQWATFEHGHWIHINSSWVFVLCVWLWALLEVAVILTTVFKPTMSHLYPFIALWQDRKPTCLPWLSIKCGVGIENQYVQPCFSLRSRFLIPMPIHVHLIFHGAGRWQDPIRWKSWKYPKRERCLSLCVTDLVM